MMRWCWVNFQCRGVLQFGLKLWQGPTALAVGAGGDCLDIFTLIYPFSPLPLSLWETARYRLKYCLKESLNQNQPIDVLEGLRGSFGADIFNLLLQETLQYRVS